jgi:hypothetical protein
VMEIYLYVHTYIAAIYKGSKSVLVMEIYSCEYIYSSMYKGSKKSVWEMERGACLMQTATCVQSAAEQHVLSWLEP